LGGLFFILPCPSGLKYDGKERRDNMEIKIKKIGTRKGTIGWFSQGLENGYIYFQEGHTKDGKHGLWLCFCDAENEKKLPIYIAGYNEEYTRKYAINLEFQNRTDMEFVTPTTIKTIQNIAKAWCDEMNLELEKEEERKVTIKRIEIKE